MIGQQAPQIEKVEKNQEKLNIPYPIAKQLKNALGFTQRTLYGNGLNVKVVGKSNIPLNRQTLVISNHCSHLDMGLVKYALGDYGRNLVGLAAQDYFFEGNKWWVAYFEQLTNLEPIDRKKGFRASFDQARDIVDRGNVVLIFPEGTRREDGTIGDFKPLIGKLALETGVDILPLHLDGTHRILPKGGAIPQGRKITVRVGPPLKISDLRRLTSDMKNTDAARTVSKLCQEAVVSLRDGSVLDLKRKQSATPDIVETDTIQDVFDELKNRYSSDRITKSISWYFSLGGKTGPRWTVSVDEKSCTIRQGRPSNGVADCVVKTSEDILTRMVREAYVPEPAEFFSGRIKTNEIPLLMEFARVFNLSEPQESM